MKRSEPMNADLARAEEAWHLAWQSCSGPNYHTAHEKSIAVIAAYGKQEWEAGRRAAEAERDKLLALLRDALDRMDRARSILRDPDCSGRLAGNWGMLDTSMIRAALKEKP